MSARAWYRRRHKPPQYVARFDWWDDFTILHGPPAKMRRVDSARRRRTASALRRVHRRHPRPFPYGWTFIGSTEQEWKLP